MTKKEEGGRSGRGEERNNERFVARRTSAREVAGVQGKEGTGVAVLRTLFGHCDSLEVEGWGTLFRGDRKMNDSR